MCIGGKNGSARFDMAVMMIRAMPVTMVLQRAVARIPLNISRLPPGNNRDGYDGSFKFMAPKQGL